MRRRPLLLVLVSLLATAMPARAQAPRLYFESDGTGLPVVFVEDWANDTSIWFRILPALRSEFELVRYDLRGQGRSEAPAEADYSLEAHRQDLLRVLDTLGIGRAHLVGAGLGGSVVLAFASAHPDRTISASVIDPHVTWRPEARQAWARFLDGYDRAGHPPLADYASVIVERWFGSTYPDVEPWIVPFVDLMLRRQASGPLIASLRAWLGSELMLSEEGSGGVSVLLLWGERAGPPAGEPRLHGAFNVRRAQVDDAGPVPHVEEPGETARLLLDFLRSESTGEPILPPPAAEPQIEPVPPEKPAPEEFEPVLPAKPAPEEFEPGEAVEPEGPPAGVQGAPEPEGPPLEPEGPPPEPEGPPPDEAPPP